MNLNLIEQAVDAEVRRVQDSANFKEQSIKEFSELHGRKISDVYFLGDGPEEVSQIVLAMEDGAKVVLGHSLDCCEYVRCEDIAGDLKDMVGAKIVRAEIVQYEADNQPSGPINGLDNDVFSWTFYKLDTTKGANTMKWYGDSNGYYSIEVSCIEASEKLSHMINEAVESGLMKSAVPEPRVEAAKEKVEIMEPTFF